MFQTTNQYWLYQFHAHVDLFHFIGLVGKIIIEDGMVSTKIEGFQ